VIPGPHIASSNKITDPYSPAPRKGREMVSNAGRKPKHDTPEGLPALAPRLGGGPSSMP
jgi:hypothetical protein